ncbi:DNA-directed RNA polymerase subunit beta' [Capsulimonas corticalis]|uniref:DNA-directed RNA polymerase subunit beta' n=1 Tax=Capsulimonas corticalis TaxID=2219043 RepID=A0A402CYK4_9BACT|nr:DNA-directed RNA polymerase subunit beta' [Capsulimonas corticalis]BDI31303.1 DNA-directed RNA polymerase subunit beta' [Capsulimonas corticalis]
MTDASAFDKIRIGIASPAEIRAWSYGEVKKPETINYRTFKPERDGLFCERIFGPVKDWECHCGRYKKVKFKGIICDRCGVEVTRSKVRRERMGHIELAAPVCHIWYLKGVPSPLSLLLDISPRPLEKVLYFASYIVTYVDRGRINNEMSEYRAALDEKIRDSEEQRDLDIEEARIEAGREIKSHEEGAEPEPVSQVIINEDGELVESEELIEPAAVEIWDAARIKDRNKHLDEEIKDIEKDSAESIQSLRDALTLLDEKVEKRMLLAEDDYRKLESLLDVLSEKLDRDMGEVVRAGLGGAAVKELLAEIDLDKLARELRHEITQTQGPKRARAIKRLEVTEAFITSKSRPEWMILDAVPVISPELRPMVQLDGGRFATSDLNDLYRRIINRNNRLKKITEIRAPESIVNHEKRLLQEAVDALIDNGRRTRPVVGSNNRPLKSLSDMLKGKEGRFRKNLLGKRVDYSGRSVIVVGPRLLLHQCGLPKEMAIELFKPFVMKALVERNYTSNIKTAKRMIDKLKPEVWDALEDVIREHPVLLNRAPTLHRLGIQAFEPVLVDGKAIQVHPLVCHAFNADFDGDQMAVHVPLSASAQAEARILMLSTHNLFSPANGSPIVAPAQDMVLGSYYLTMMREGEPTKPFFASADEAALAFDTQTIELHEPIDVYLKQGDDEHRTLTRTTVGRILFSNILPTNMRYVNKLMNKKGLGELIARCHRTNGDERTIILLDELKALGFREATKAGMTVAITDMDVPEKRNEILKYTEEEVKKLNRSYQRGLITSGERKERVLESWQKAAKDVGEAIFENIDRYNPIFMFTDSSARGTRGQVTQLSGMRGVMSDPFGNMIEDLPVKSNFHEGLSTLEYFVSTHGARKGLADTALRTADAGYLTRRLVDVSQEVIVRDADCNTEMGIYVEEIRDSGEVIEPLNQRIYGRFALVDIAYPASHEKAGEIIVAKGDLITEGLAREIEASGLKRAGVRSPFTCELRMGICAKCYGLDLANSKLVEPGVAVGIIAAQSIGEPGTQLTMRTFHTGGIAQKQLVGVANVRQRKQEALKELHNDIASGIVNIDSQKDDNEKVPGAATVDRERVRAVQAVLKVLEDQVGGLLRVVELFEARKPKGQAIVTEYAGEVADIEMKGLRKVIIHTTVALDEGSTVGLNGEKLGVDVYLGSVDTEGMTAAAAKRAAEIPENLTAGTELTEKMIKKMREVGITAVKIRKEIMVPYRGTLQVKPGDVVEAGDRLTEGPLDPQKVLELQGIRGVQNYVVREIQSVYTSQGVNINDKHIEVIARQMLRKRKIKSQGDSEFLPGQMVDKFEFEDTNRAIIERETPGTEATADWLLLGITEASLATDSFLSAASFQKTTRVLTEAAVRGKKDSLVGLKENVIIGRLIPAGTGLPQYRNLEPLLEGMDAASKPVGRGNGRGGAAVLDQETTLNDDDLAVIREATGTSGDSLSLLAEREAIGGDSDAPTIDNDSDSAI